MKKHIVIILLLLLMTLCVFCACSPAEEAPEIVPYEKDHPAAIFKTSIAQAGNGGGPSISVAPKTIWSRDYFNNDQASAEMTVNFNGITYSGKYVESTIQAKTSYVADFYKTPNGIRFSVRSDTKELVSLNLATASFFREQALATDKEDPQAFAIAYAKELGSAMVNLDDYTISTTTSELSKLVDGVEHKYTMYIISFDKMIGELKTADGFTIRITSRGALISYASTERTTFDSFSNENCTREAIEASIYAILKEQAEVHKERYVWTDYQAKEHTLVKFPDGRLAVYSEIKVGWYSIEGNCTYNNGYRLYTLLEP